MKMTDDEETWLFDSVLRNSADLSALKRIMFTTNPQMAAEHQRISDELFETLILDQRVRRSKGEPPRNV